MLASRNLTRSTRSLPAWRQPSLQTGEACLSRATCGTLHNAIVTRMAQAEQSLSLAGLGGPGWAWVLCLACSMLASCPCLQCSRSCLAHPLCATAQGYPDVDWLSSCMPSLRLCSRSSLVAKREKSFVGADLHAIMDEHGMLNPLVSRQLSVMSHYSVKSESGSVMITPEEAEAPFKLIRLIGRGGFGNVYLGDWDAKRVAIKVGVEAVWEAACSKSAGARPPVQTVACFMHVACLLYSMMCTCSTTPPHADQAEHCPSGPCRSSQATPTQTSQRSRSGRRARSAWRRWRPFSCLQLTMTTSCAPSRSAG